MARMQTLDGVEAGVVGGLFLSAGGSGRNAVETNRGLGRMALDYGGVRLAGIDELDPQDLVITATAVRAPSFANCAIRPRDAINAARRLLAYGPAAEGAICGHVPGFNAWLIGAAMGFDYVDLASNGRGHPTVKMGGMGLASRPELTIAQVAVSGGRSETNELAVCVEGDIVRTSNMLRQAAVLNGRFDICGARAPHGFFHADERRAGRDLLSA